MSGECCVCTTDDACPRHGKFIYFCQRCHEEWQVANPHTTEAIGRFAAGEIGRSMVDAAKKKDRALRADALPTKRGSDDDR